MQRLMMLEATSIVDPPAMLSSLQRFEVSICEGKYGQQPVIEVDNRDVGLGLMRWGQEDKENTGLSPSWGSRR